MGPTPFYGARAGKPPFCQKANELCRLSGDIIIASVHLVPKQQPILINIICHREDTTVILQGFNTLTPAAFKMCLKQLFHVTLIFRLVFSQRTTFSQP